MARSYRSFIAALARGISALADGPGQAFVGALHGFLADGIAAAASQAVRSPWMTLKDQPDDALAPIGSERNMPRYPGESTASYRARLHGAWRAYARAGDESSILTQLAAAGYAGAVIFDAWTTAIYPPLDCNGNRWWSRFIVFFPVGAPNVPGPPKTWDSFSWDDGTVYDMTGNSDAVATIRGIVAKWKPVRWRFSGLIFQLSGFAYDEGRKWDEPGLSWDGSNIIVGA